MLSFIGKESRSYLLAASRCRTINYNVIKNKMTSIDPIQESLLQENCILVDKNDKKIGSATKRQCHQIKDGRLPPLHRAFSVFLFNSSGELLLQQRSAEKVTFPNHYTNTCCSHPLHTEDELNEEDSIGVKIAAMRKLQQELGIQQTDYTLSDFSYLTRIYYSRASDGSWGEHEIDYILFLQKDLELKPNLNEVQAVKYIKRSEFDSFLDQLKLKNVAITPWFEMICRKHLKLWWSNLDNLKQFVDHKNIIRF